MVLHMWGGWYMWVKEIWVPGTEDVLKENTDKIGGEGNIA